MGRKRYDRYFILDEYRKWIQLAKENRFLGFGVGRENAEICSIRMQELLDVVFPIYLEKDGTLNNSFGILSFHSFVKADKAENHYRKLAIIGEYIIASWFYDKDITNRFPESILEYSGVLRSFILFLSETGYAFADTFSDRESMIDELLMHCEKTDFRKYAWAFCSYYENGRLMMNDIIELIILFWRRSVCCILDDDYVFGDEYINIPMADSISVNFAFQILKKGLLDNRWSYRNGVFIDNGKIISVESIHQTYTSMIQMIEDDRVEESRRENAPYFIFEKMKDFNIETESFLLALIDHCTEDNALVIMAMHEYPFCNAKSLEELAKLSVSASWEQFSFISYEHAIPYGSIPYFELGGDHRFIGGMQETMKKTRSAKEFFYKEAEIRFYLRNYGRFPYFTYLFLTDQLEDLDIVCSLLKQLLNDPCSLGLIQKADCIVSLNHYYGVDSRELASIRYGNFGIVDFDKLKIAVEKKTEQIRLLALEAGDIKINASGSLSFIERK